MEVCPSCEDKFDTERAMAIHHKLSHGESLVKEEANCSECGTKFEYYPSEKDGLYCSECVDEVNWGGGEGTILEGKENPNYKGGDVEVACSLCGESFKVEQWRKKKYGRVFCDNSCRLEWFSQKASEETAEFVTISCDNCDEDFERQKSQVRYDNQFCDPDCRGEWFSKEYNGSQHPRWEGGHCTSYGRTWNKKREEQLERDNYTCVICGKGNEELGHNPHVHHREPVREFDDPDDAHFKKNLVTLCPKHHGLAETGKIDV